MEVDPEELRARQAKVQKTLFWPLWATFLGMSCFYYYSLRQGAPAEPKYPDPADWQWGMLPVFLSAIVRWTILPRITRL